MNFSHRKGLILRVVSAVITAAFGVQEMAWAAPMAMPAGTTPMPAVEFKIPASAGMMDDYYRAARPSGDKENQTGKLIVLVQDAHTNDSAQFNAARILNDVLKAEKIRLIFTEADHGNVSLSYLQKYFDSRTLEKVAASFVRKGLLKGTEYLSVTSDEDFVLQGIESPVLYDESLRAYDSVVKGRARALAWLDRLNRSLKTLQDDVFSPELAKIEEARLKKNTGGLSLAAYAEIIWKEAGRLGVYRDAYRSLADLNRVSRLEKKIDFKQAATEADAAMKSLDPSVRQALTAGSGHAAQAAAAKSGEDASAGFYEALEASLLAQKNSGELARVHPALFAYFRYLHQARRLEALRAIGQLDQLESEVFARLARTAEERYLVEFGRNAEDLESMLQMKLSPEAFERFEDRQKRFDPRMIGGYVNHRILQTSKHLDSAVFLDRNYEKVAGEAVRFYRLAAKRDEIFVDRMIGQMESAGQSRSALFMGGFHAPGIKRLLRARGVSYVSILPNVTHETDQSRYEKILLSQNIAGRRSRAVAMRANTRLALLDEGQDYAAQPLGAINGSRLSFFEAVARTQPDISADSLLTEGRSQESAGPVTAPAAARLASLHQAHESGKDEVVFWSKERVRFDRKETMNFYDFYIDLSAPWSEHKLMINTQSRHPYVLIGDAVLVTGSAVSHESSVQGLWGIAPGSDTHQISYPVFYANAGEARKPIGYLNIEVSEAQPKETSDHFHDNNSSAVMKVFWTRFNPAASAPAGDFRIGEQEPDEIQRRLMDVSLRNYVQRSINAGDTPKREQDFLMSYVTKLESRGILTLGQLGGVGMWDLFKGNRVSPSNFVTEDFMGRFASILRKDGIVWGYDSSFVERLSGSDEERTFLEQPVKDFFETMPKTGNVAMVTRAGRSFAEWARRGASSDHPIRNLRELIATPPAHLFRARNMGVATLGMGMAFLDQQIIEKGFSFAWGRGFVFTDRAGVEGARMSANTGEQAVSDRVIDSLRWIPFQDLWPIRDRMEYEARGLAADTDGSLEILPSGLAVPDRQRLRGQYALYVDLGGSTIHIGIAGVNAETGMPETLWHEDILLSHQEKQNGGKLFDRIADVVADRLLNGKAAELLAAKNINLAQMAAGFTFSFPHKDGIIQRSANVKGFNFKDVYGQSVMDIMNAKLEEKGVGTRFNAVVNDTEAALIQGIVSDERTRASVIAGTGFNIAAVLRGVITNLEAGGFRIQDLKQARLLDIERGFIKRGAEELIAGGFIGDLVRIIILDLATQGVILQNVFIPWQKPWKALKFWVPDYWNRVKLTYALYMPGVLNTGGLASTLSLASPRKLQDVLNEALPGLGDRMDQSDLDTVQKIIRAVGERSADIVAAMAAGALGAAGAAKSGRVSADGALWQNDWYLARVNTTLGRLLGRRGESDILFLVHNASGQGAALTALAKRANEASASSAARMAASALVPWEGEATGLDAMRPDKIIVLTDPIKALAVTVGYFPDLYETVRDNPFVKLAGAIGDYEFAEEVSDLVRDIVGPVAETPYIAEASKHSVRLYFLRYGLHVYLRADTTDDGKVLLNIYATPYKGSPDELSRLHPDQKREFNLTSGGDGKIWEEDLLIGTALFRASLTNRMLELLQELSAQNNGVKEFLSAYEALLADHASFDHLGSDDMAVRWADAREQRRADRLRFESNTAWEERIQSMTPQLRDRAIAFGALPNMEYLDQTPPKAVMQDVEPGQRKPGYFKEGDPILVDTREWGIPPSRYGGTTKAIVTGVWEDSVSFVLVTDDGFVDSRLGAYDLDSREIWKWNQAVEPFTPENRPLQNLEYITALGLPKPLTDYLFNKLNIFYPQMLALLLQSGDLNGGALADDQVSAIRQALLKYKPKPYAGARMAQHRNPKRAARSSRGARHWRVAAEKHIHQAEQVLLRNKRSRVTDADWNEVILALEGIGDRFINDGPGTVEHKLQQRIEELLLILGTARVRGGWTQQERDFQDGLARIASGENDVIEVAEPAGGARMSALIEGRPTVRSVQNAYVEFTIQSKSGPSVINEATFTDLGAKLRQVRLGEQGKLRGRNLMRQHEDGSLVSLPNGLAAPDGTPLMLPTSSRVKQGKVTALDGTVVDLKDALFARKFPDLQEGPHTLHGILDKVVWNRVQEMPRPDTIAFVKRYQDVPLFTEDSEAERVTKGLRPFAELYPGIRTLADIYGDVEVRVRYTLKGQELVSEMELKNLSATTAAPLGGGFHPFPQLAADDEELKDWSVRLPANKTVLTDTTSRVPLRPAVGTPLLREVANDGSDVRQFTDLRAFEEVLTGLTPDADGLVRGQFVNRKTGEVIEFSWDPKQFPFAVLWVPMGNGPMKGVASIEPTLSAPDALNLSAEGYLEAEPIRLAPGQIFGATYSVKRTTLDALASRIDYADLLKRTRSYMIDIERDDIKLGRGAEFLETLESELRVALQIHSGEQPLLDLVHQIRSGIWILRQLSDGSRLADSASSDGAASSPVMILNREALESQLAQIAAARGVTDVADLPVANGEVILGMIRLEADGSDAYYTVTYSIVPGLEKNGKIALHRSSADLSGEMSDITPLFDGVATIDQVLEIDVSVLELFKAVRGTELGNLFRPVNFEIDISDFMLRTRSDDPKQTLRKLTALFDRANELGLGSVQYIGKNDNLPEAQGGWGLTSQPRASGPTARLWNINDLAMAAVMKEFGYEGSNVAFDQKEGQIIPVLGTLLMANLAANLAALESVLEPEYEALHAQLITMLGHLTSIRTAQDSNSLDLLLDFDSQRPTEDYRKVAVRGISLKGYLSLVLYLQQAARLAVDTAA